MRTCGVCETILLIIPYLYRCKSMKYIFNIFHYCRKDIGTKPLRLLMDQRSGKFLGALNQNKLMGSPKAGTSQGASPPGTGSTYTSPPQTFTSRGMVQHKPRMMRPRRMWPGERPPVPSSMTSNINQVRKGIKLDLITNS